MKSTGVIRKTDVLPVELRRTLAVTAWDRFEIFTDGETIILSKYDAACTFCAKLLSRS
ncbi:AbrB/MazE/SpoVT family DNA-binding domain-containing protein [Alicyclobacillus fastidiosus]|uniref:AbrB/MazE/SpoVT family DNA-binding domain-containing protein n=1 Tax=Alicyclobacillus fastidiosus TaxID=392011 RepID=A0ABY6ZKI6_9BACL|nr:hypothetical protein [Alicyclobacillus fastidiosus]WAH43448.1 AbrB/MazE/SpoVT family DNA-binding domain-containing protein [Alicyclobacillus fastidiosus]GMA59600.1 hypothetical protein GCM10025859_00400 [Alicyclobacillus fastidiosus]